MLRRTIIIIIGAVISACDAGVQTAEAPRSLEGTEIDGALRTSSDGAFLFDEQAQLAFDYFLTADGELTAEQLEAWVSASIDQRLEARAGEDALAAWHGYSAYRREAAELMERGGDPREVEARVIAALERELGGWEITALERERIGDAFAVTQSLSSIPAFPRKKSSLVGDPASFLDVRRAVEDARASGATPAAIHALRTRAYGVEAADRLAALDARRAAR